ncbi:NAD(P)-binding domain-containing protein [Geodermatophilus sp. URMC 61]|uniref:NAD(P)-binding domain-containing protein n=1 Tax=Geodermatophilus sp. URMC 61 TaxID=3423411 RepID=UPI00406CE49E
MVLVSSVGVIGLDPVGGTVARRLLDQGLEVTAHDPDPWTVATMTPAGATPARIPADAAEPADVVFVHVPDETAVEEVLFDCGGVGETLRDGGFVVAASATGATFVLSAAERLAALGLKTVEAWFTGLSGGVPDTVLVGCAPGELEVLTPVLRMIAANVARVGPLGSVSELRSAATALMRVRPLLSEDESSAAACELLRVLTGPVGDVSRGSAPNGRGDRPATQPTPPPARVPGDPPVDGHPVLDARQHVERDRRGAGAPRPRAPQQRGVLARRGSPRSSTVLDVPPGVLTHDELTDVVDAVCGPGRGSGSTPGTATGGAPHDTNCLGLASAEFEDVVAELERRCRVPLLREALQCSTPGELVALVNKQVTSGV